MAKASFNLPFNHPFSASMGGFSMFTRKDSDKIIFRSKGGASANKILNDKAFASTRLQMSEFGGCSSAARMMREAMVSVKDLSNLSLHGQFVKLASRLRDMDTNPRGTRSIIFSRGKYLIDGFSLNRITTFDSVISSPVTFSIERNTYTAVVQLPPLSPGMNFNSAWTYPFYRFKINLGILRDLVFEEKKGYHPVLTDPKEYTATLDTEWNEAKNKQIGQEVGIHISNPVFNESCHLMLSIGIEFGTSEEGKIKAIKHAGCGKILGMM